MNELRDDRYYMARALELARKGMGFTSPNPMVGAVIVKEGRIIAEGYHHCCGQAHAEVDAFNHAAEDVTGATIYVTLEPCAHYGKTPPCADRIIQEKLARVVVGALDPNPLVSGKGLDRIRAAGIEVVTGVMAEESYQLNEIFMKYIKTKQPFVLYKSAMSMDGKIATASGESQWISCETSREAVQQLRHRFMGIMVGSETVLADDPRLTCRIPGGRNPVRIVADSRLRIPADCELIKTAREVRTIIATLETADAAKISVLEQAGAEVIRLPGINGHIDLKALMIQLGQMQIDSILLEGGGTLAYAAFEAGIIDKIQMYVAPMIIGGRDARTPVSGVGISALSKAWHLTGMKVTASGEDICITGDVVRQEE